MVFTTELNSTRQDAMTTAAYHHGANIARTARVLKPYRDTLFARGNQSPTPELVEAFSMGGSGGVPAPDANPAHRQPPPDGFVSGAAMPGPTADKSELSGPGS